ncbi:hypothetical protein DL732_19550 [Escherichia coli]|nr:hypothetical protein [Escherichia coli]EMW96800.1 hypothetical protein ECTHROOPD_2477 [Escherichia coli ThroopD]EMX19137.1 hypothetical protein ECP03018671_3005 [Escherichia coli P0301867.1]EMX84971.1 hypothetical protein EC2719100_3075 [Escherichia coli 2719100]EMZ78458.1 hypothetical protein EC2722950_3247 [Escherichia coli 2722950]ENA38326.1 hypothetical protein ECP03018672_5337 [Escherichia coli P0301867.2]ENA43128.1 hypothetical protein ECP03018674_5278 [Escherichia coli P0301867.4]E
MAPSYARYEKYTIHTIQIIHTIQFIHTIHTVQNLHTLFLFSRSDPVSGEVGSRPQQACFALYP